MEENNNNNNEKEFSVDINKEELKNQTKETVNQVKETIKNVDFKKDASATKSFVLEMIKKPFTTINDIVTEKENRFAIAVILMICFMVVPAAGYAITYLGNEYLEFKFVDFLIEAIRPLLYVLAFTTGVVLFGGKDKKNITTTLSALTIAYTPKLISGLFSLVYSLVTVKGIGYINSIVSNFASFLAVSLTYVAIKGLITADEDEDKLFRKIAVIAGVAFIILKILNICGIY